MFKAVPERILFCRGASPDSAQVGLEHETVYPAVKVVILAVRYVLDEQPLSGVKQPRNRQDIMMKINGLPVRETITIGICLPGNVKG